MAEHLNALTLVINAIQQGLVEQLDEQTLIQRFTPEFKKLLKDAHWLKPEFKKPHPEYYQQYLLYLDPEERFSIVSFVWGGGQKTPIHNHEVWGAIGVLAGAEISTPYTRDEASLHAAAQGDYLGVGDIDWFTPTTGDIHAVQNAFEDQVSISIHIYGANIGKVERFTYQLDGTAKPFISGYSNI
ncbi:cysteine dioxygenase [Acinetobacter sp. ANC 4779]|uniref:cysteine dioxygenase family protein n=1 Tax=Acinetobacter Taxon 24C TaxID=2839060 RepID=UPI0007D769DC|nr:MULTISPECIES: cysteine dioxygenase [Acinetobacter Taxon 24C]OAL78517.1 cysteine dioxygenase [Acinetobacter sp. SFB]TCB52483.1 cysteine dioxygenase [Acinetobacter sp. ANC 4779]